VFRLRTLGQLRLDGANFRREKPLLLLAYLSLEGAKLRRHLAQLFWPDAKDPLNSLSVAVSKLRSLGVVQADETRAWSDVACDALELRAALREGRAEAALELYEGAFLDGLQEPIGVELEEWLLERREALALEVRAALVALAERAAATGAFDRAASHAEAAVSLQDAAPLQPEELSRLHRLLVAAEHPASLMVRRDASAFGLTLPESPQAARGQLRSELLGRARELEALQALPLGAWAWLRGGADSGKTALLHELERHGWLFIGARSGLPYATLEGLVDLSGGEDTVLRRLLRLDGRFAFDDWELIDTETQSLLRRWWSAGSTARAVVAARSEPAFASQRYVEIGSLEASALHDLPGAFEATGGLPALVGAWLRGEPVQAALEAQLSALPLEARRVYAALTLLDAPDLSFVRRALGASAAEFAHSTQVLFEAGLIEASGEVRGHATARAHLAARPGLETQVALGLARAFGNDLRSLPLYQRAAPLWEETDLPAVRRAFSGWARELLRRGFPARAAEVLRDAPPCESVETALLLARCLERAGQFRQAFDALENVPDSSASSALRGALLWRLGKPEAARLAAQESLNGDFETRAEGLNTLGHLEFAVGQYATAKSYFSRAAALWLAQGERSRWADALNNQAMAQTELGENPEAAFSAALEAVEDNLASKARVLLNKGRVLERRGDALRASLHYTESAATASTAGASKTAATAWLNLGALHHRAQQHEDAQRGYERALELARTTGDPLLLGTVLSNLAELTGNLGTMEEAMRLLESSGNRAMLEEIRQTYQQMKVRLESFDPRSGVHAQA
jgi:tetratricopeptide (TPR) repeat protein